MAENKYKEFARSSTVHSQATAAIADIAEKAPDSGVGIPDEMQIIAAKEFVDENEK